MNTENTPARQGGEQQPSVGRVVHFVYGDQHVPAIITHPDFQVERGDDPWQGTHQALAVFLVNEPGFTTVAHEDAGAAPGTWHWPEFVPPKP